MRKSQGLRVLRSLRAAAVAVSTISVYIAAGTVVIALAAPREALARQFYTGSVVGKCVPYNGSTYNVMASTNWAVTEVQYVFTPVPAKSTSYADPGGKTIYFLVSPPGTYTVTVRNPEIQGTYSITVPACAPPPNRVDWQEASTRQPTGTTLVPINLNPVTPNKLDCAKTVVVSGIHYPDKTCAQSSTEFQAGMLTSYHLTSKCPQDAPLTSVFDISCQNAPIPGFSTGSVYKATACCGKAASLVPISNLPMQGGNEKTPCPALGGIYKRSDAASVPYLGIVLPNLDQQCGAKGPGMHVVTVKFLKCAPDPRGKGFGPNASADLTCAK